MNFTKNDRHAFWVLVILAPLIGTTVAPFNAFPAVALILGILFFGILDIGHKYLTIILYWKNFKNKSDNKKLLLIGIASLLFSFAFYLQINHLWMIFFYISTLHFYWQIDWFYEYLLDKLPNKNIDRIILMASLILNFLIIHTSPHSLISTFYQDTPLPIESAEFFNWAITIDTLLFLLITIFMALRLAKKRITKEIFFYFFFITLFARIIYYTPELLGGDPLFVIIAMHSLPIIYFIAQQFRHQSKINFNWKQIIGITIILTVIDFELLTDEIEIGTEYIIHQPDPLMALGTGLLIGISLLHFYATFCLKNRMPLISYIVPAVHEKN